VSLSIKVRFEPTAVLLGVNWSTEWYNVYAGPPEYTLASNPTSTLHQVVVWLYLIPCLLITIQWQKEHHAKGKKK